MNAAEFTPESISSLFSSLFVVDFKVTSCDANDHSDSPKIFGVFRNNEGALVAVCKADLEFAARSAGALTMIPPDGCNDAIDEKEISGTLCENSREVMNLLGTMVHTDNGTRAYLAEFVTNESAVSEDVGAMIDASQSSVSLNVEFQRYGSGVFSFIV